ncbi:WXG100 family type VII secretion target [Streptomyces toxytricini]|uniref:WXG100 family type VII secretion target n=1 Tax=Streptomyces toxytricini TaxID=67369 RepID=A0ABW8ECG9_STRT5
MATNFEGYTHQQLLAMVKTLNPDLVKTRAAQLIEAAEAITKIGEDLRNHKVKGWEGEAALAFEQWASRASTATLHLGKYSASAGKWMQAASQTMYEVKDNIPAYDSAAAKNLQVSKEHRNEPDAQQLGREAHAKLSGDHTKAIDALTKLAQSYEQSKTQIAKEPIPTFPPMPGNFVPTGNYDSDSGYLSRGGSASGETYGAGGSYGPSASRSGPSGDSGVTPGRLAEPVLPQNTGPVSAPGLPDRDINVGLDNVAVLPDKTMPPVTGMPPTPGPGPVMPGPVAPMPPVMPVAPGTGPTLGGGGGSLNKVPPVAGPPSGGKLGMPPLMPRDTGIIGGRQVPSATGPTTGLPRGLVVGSEGAHPGGRPPAAMGMHSGMGGAHPSGPGGNGAGRRLAMEPGGVIGGARQPGAMPPGVVGRAAPSGQPFTHGGSGLVRNTPAGESGRGGMGHAGAGAHAPGRNERQGGERPDYLAEDEETWRSNDRVVPRVID